jgi:hypothetical protein
MIAFAAFLFALLVVAWLFAPNERQAKVAEHEPATGMQPEQQTA